MTENPLFVAKTYAGLEEVLANELTQLGAGNIEVLTRAVEFTGDQKLMYAANYNCRTALRVLKSLHRFELDNEDDLYLNVNRFPWEQYFSIQQTFAVDAVVFDSEMTHSHFVALRTKDAICDRFRERNNGRRPSVDTDNPDFRVHIHISQNACDIQLDSSGASLHKRGYRVSNAEAPLSEVLAAGLVLLSGWKKNCQFIDPMCGSGTLLIEAALIANNIPCGMYRKDFGFMYWNDFDRDLFEEVKAEAFDRQTEFEYEIVGYDISSRNLSAAKANVKAAKLHKDIQLQVADIRNLTLDFEQPGYLITNPPYGERVKSDDIVGLYRDLGDVLKKNFQNYTAWVISADFWALKNIGLKSSQTLNVWNGPLECKVLKFELYQGSKKGKYLSREEEGMQKAESRRNKIEEAGEMEDEHRMPKAKNKRDKIEEAGEMGESPWMQKAEGRTESFSKVKRDRGDLGKSLSRQEKQDLRRKFFTDGESENMGEKGAFSKEKESFAERKSRSFDRKEDKPFGERKPRSFYNKEDKPFRERKPRSFDNKEDKPFRERKPRSFDNKEDNPFGERKSRSFDRKEDKPFGERRPRSFDNKEAKPFRERKPRSFDNKEAKSFGERKPRSFDRKEDKPFHERKPRSFDKKEDKPFRERKPRSFDKKEDKPFRERKPRSFDKKEDKPFKERKSSGFDKKEDKPLTAGRKSFIERRSFERPPLEGEKVYFNDKSEKKQRPRTKK